MKECISLAAFMPEFFWAKILHNLNMTEFDFHHYHTKFSLMILNKLCFFIGQLTVAVSKRNTQKYIQVHAKNFIACLLLFGGEQYYRRTSYTFVYRLLNLIVSNAYIYWTIFKSKIYLSGSYISRSYSYLISILVTLSPNRHILQLDWVPQVSCWSFTRDSSSAM